MAGQCVAYDELFGRCRRVEHPSWQRHEAFGQTWFTMEDDVVYAEPEKPYVADYMEEEYGAG